VWSIENETAAGLVQGLFWLGWLVVLLSTFMINHFDLFGLRQTWLAVKGAPYKHLDFRTTGFYSYVRHPILVGFLIAFWATPTMTAGHLLFAVMTTGYIIVAVKMFEEPDLKQMHPGRYQAYMEQVPALIPRLTKPSVSEAPIEE
jgi:protein-S-isoprenylcysteine O-methyltransferase Ste14